MTPNPLFDIKWYAKRLAKNSDEMMTLNKQYKTVDTFTMNYVDLYALHQLVEHQSSLIHNLNESLADYEMSLKKQRPFWKHFRK